ncbi:MAG: 50S ribosomal protein L32 [Armatimonadota bacterium]|nr:50S ribosomal protein L32 [Armatimonadota bacterium]MDW8025426.1 50S ribosomal protein L32 [Armatimonadota bacterium]
MAVPKRKVSRTRRDKRRTHWKLKTPTFSSCPQCGKPMRSHCACTFCGYYKGMVVLPKARRGTGERA